MKKVRADQSTIGVVLVLVSLALGVTTVYVSAQQPPNTLATAILQAVTLIFGTVGSYLFSFSSAKNAADESLKRHARSAFRRVRYLYGALGRFRKAIEQQSLRLDQLKQANGSKVEYEHVRASLIALDQLVAEQIATADDAIEDWRDVIPEEIREIEAQARRRAEQVDSE